VGFQCFLGTHIQLEQGLDVVAQNAVEHSIELRALKKPIGLVSILDALFSS
jgi:hypothetical protein